MVVFVFGDWGYWDLGWGGASEAEVRAVARDGLRGFKAGMYE
jgi:hypothetical protein